MSGEPYELLFKFVLIGDSGVGKTNMMSQYLRKEFNSNSKATVGVEFGSKIFDIEGRKVKCQIWDTAGQERYKSITSAYYKGARGAFIVYDITRRETFESIDKWMNNLKNSADSNISIVIVGNKSDLKDERQVEKEDGENKAQGYQSPFFETSALNGENIEKVFELLVNQVYQKNHLEMEKSKYKDSVGLSDKGKNLDTSNHNDNKKSGCC